MLHSWMLPLLSLPPRPSSLRVRAWRRLRALGAVPLKSGAHLLPDSADRYEQLQWLAPEIRRDGGDATLLRVDRIENETLLRRTGLHDRRLAILAEIVREADLKDQKFAREEARGVTLFDGLYPTIGERA